MSKKKYIVELTDDERVILKDVVRRLKGTSQKIVHHLFCKSMPLLNDAVSAGGGGK